MADETMTTSPAAAPVTPAAEQDARSSPDGSRSASSSIRSSDQNGRAESATSISDAGEDRCGKSSTIKTGAEYGPSPVSHASVTTTGRRTSSAIPSSPFYSHPWNSDVSVASSTLATSSIPRASSLSPTLAPSTPRKRPRQGGISSMIDQLNVTSLARRRRVKGPVPAEAAG